MWEARDRRLSSQSEARIQGDGPIRGRDWRTGHKHGTIEGLSPGSGPGAVTSAQLRMLRCEVMSLVSVL